MSAQPAMRIPQPERSRMMRRRLMEATAELLVERGFVGTTTTLVSQRAGVSRGAQLHHFPTKDDLVQAAVEYVADSRAQQLSEAVTLLPSGPHRTYAVLTMLGDHFAGPVFIAALELWVAARTDPELRTRVATLEQRLGRDIHRLTVEALGLDESEPGVRELVQATLDLVRGLGLANSLSDDGARRRRVLRRWAAVLDELLPERSTERHPPQAEGNVR